jgi:malate dehydrogenase (oxaloacetate-decarboxylating)(NADP+)
MKPVFDRAKQDPRRVVYCEGEEERVLQAVQTVVDEGIAKPILIGRQDVVAKRIQQLGLRLRQDHDFELVNPESDPRYPEYWRLLHSLMERRGVTPELARELTRTRTTVIGSLMLRRGEAEAMLCGTSGAYPQHLRNLVDIIGADPTVHVPAALTMLILSKGVYFLVDTHVTYEPT